MIKVGVLMGGPSAESGISMKTGESVLANLPKNYFGKDIVISKQGDWLFNGAFSHPEKILRSVDVVFNALHGVFGEDGKVQQILEVFGVPYTGSAVLASAVGMNKILAREFFGKAGLLTPLAAANKENEPSVEFAKRVLRTMGPAWVVKPASSGSSVGVSIARDFDALVSAVEAALAYGPRVIVEEFIEGREATCGVVDDFRKQEYYALPVIEIIPPEKSDFFDYDAKYGGETREVCPANFDQPVKTAMEDMARKAHKALGCRHYSRADFIVSKRRANGETKIYILEVNTLPGLTTESLLPKAINAIGSSYSEFLDHLLTLALKK
ncbi:MAG TPA: D-alanine--D-alanine ligase [Candidatus Campbellbacteria bacterium]|nr:D-alanine--D-alanine ligase [Candidatus Campbellbacteria bacterium]